ncbi:hypothetical protein KY289_008400 [Solanum tuberosum]|nr:hypothetical protein KY289_008400 [Solanum tuberosum]
MDKELKMVLEESHHQITQLQTQAALLKNYMETPEEHQVKCTTDGACQGNSGQSSFGFCNKDSRGDLIYAKAKGIGIVTNMEAETSVILSALRECLRRRLWNAIIETDSLSLKKIILKTWRIPWEIIEKVEEIWELLQKTRATITHVFREGNCLVDALSNIAIESQRDNEYQAWQELPLVLKKILNSDKAQIPNYRIKTRKITHNDT